MASARRVRVGILLTGLCVVLATTAANAQSAQRVRVKVQGYDPYGGVASFNNLVCYRLMQEDHQLEVVPYQQMAIQGGPGAEAGRYMAHAANMGPDVTTWLTFHNIRSYVRQGFYLPLNEYIGHDGYYGVDLKTGKRHALTGRKKRTEDLVDPTTGHPKRNPDATGATWDRNGYVDDDEALWPAWQRVPEYYRRVATIDGKVYGVPNMDMGMACLLYRKDLFRKAGLPADTPPTDFDQLYRWLQKLTRPELRIPGARMQRGRRGIAVEPQGWQFCAWVWAAGGDLVMQGKTNPRTGKTHWYPQEDLTFIDPDTGDDLTRQPSTWKATFGDEGGQRALGFYRRMRFARWTRDPDTGQPIDLTDAEVAAGRKHLPRGAVLTFTPD